MKVTFDSNMYRRVTDPSRFSNDPAHHAFVSIHEAIQDGRVQPFFSATIVTLEAIGRDTRGDYLSNNRVKVESDERAGEGGSIQVRMTIGPDNDLHPGLPEITERWLTAAINLGFRFLAAPRIGQPRPAFLDQQERFAPLDWVDFEVFGAVVRAIEDRGLGIAQARAIANTIIARDPKPNASAHWSSVLREAADIHETRAIARAVAEWSDADAIGAHIAYKCDIFCTEDLGKSAGAPSVLSPEARTWLSSEYGLVICSANELVSRLQ